MINQSKTFFAFAPASVGNFGPFYDVAGFCLQHLGDIVEARQKESSNEARLISIQGPYAKELNSTGISLEENNVQQVANWIWRNHATSATPGLDLILHKYLPLNSGLGSSSASCVATAKCILIALGLDDDLPEEAKIYAAMQGKIRNNELEHLDNILPSFFGGVWRVGDDNFHPIKSADFTVLAFLDEADRRSTQIQRILVKDHLREVIEDNNIGGSINKLLGYLRFSSHASMEFIHALDEGDLKSVGKLINSEEGNFLFEARHKSIPGLKLMKQHLMDGGAYGCAISGSGPAIFALVKSMDAAELLRDDIIKKLPNNNLHWLISPLNRAGAEAVENVEDWYKSNCDFHSFW